jgi:beta-glucosidase
MRNQLGYAIAVSMILCIAGLSCSNKGPRIAEGKNGTAISIENWPAGAGGAEKDPEIERKIAAILSRMDLEHKIGQMVQVSIESCTYDDIKKYHIGSVLNGGGSYPHGNRNALIKDWVAAADSFWRAAMDDSVVQIPVIWGTDAVHGHNNIKGATIFPHNIGLGAAHDPELMERIGEITAREVAVTGLDWTFAPTVAVVRDDRWGRTYESYSEKPDVVRTYAEKIITGLQGNLDEEHIIATAKHFLGDGGTTSGTDRGDTRCSERELIARHAQGYLAAIKAGVQTIMVSFSSWNGEAMHGHRYLLTTVLKERLGFDGFIISDWNGIGEVSGCSKSDCPAAINAGIDMFMIPFEPDWKGFIATVKKQVASGDVPLSRIDDAVTRILRVKFRAGLFDKPQPSKRKLANRNELFGCAEHRSVAREAVRKSLVLLKNNGALLPLSRSSRILVAGKSADCISNQCGGWSVTWQGSGTNNLDFPGATSVIKAVRNVASHVKFDATGKTAARGCYDVAIAVIGETPYAEFEGDIKGGLTLEHAKTNPEDIAVIDRIKKARIPVVTIFLSGRPLYVNRELNRSDAFVAAWLPGTEADGITDVLFRNENGGVNHDFSGKLSFSWPKKACQTSLNSDDTPYDPLFPCGFGLTYSDTAAFPGDLPEETNEGYGCSGKPIATVDDKKPVTIFTVKTDTSVTLWIGDPSNWTGVPCGDGASLPNVSLSYVNDKKGQPKSAVSLAYTGMAYCGMRWGAKDLTGYYLAGYSVAFDVNVRRRPEKSVAISVVCGYPCKASCDITKQLKECKRDAWKEIRIPLSAFARADFFTIDCPFMLESAGAVEVTLANVRWEAEKNR